MATRVLGLPEIAENQAGKYITHNTALHKIDGWVSVLSRTNSGPPGSPTQGDAYIVDSATGDWSGFTVGDIAVYYLDSSGAASWVSTSPVVGPRVWIEDETAEVLWDSVASEWKTVGALTVPELMPSDATYTLDLARVGKFLVFDNTCTITVPLNSATALPVGYSVTIRRNTASAVTISPTGGVTVNGAYSLSSQYDYVTLIKVDTDRWEACS